MYSVSATWESIVAKATHEFEVSVVIGGAFADADPDNGIPEQDLMSLTINYREFAENYPTVGGALSAEFRLKLVRPSTPVPRMAPVYPFVRCTDGTNTSEWIPQGVFYTDTRSYSYDPSGLQIMELHGYDAMLMAEAPYPETAGAWPKTDIAVVNEIATAMGVNVDSRVAGLLTRGYSISLPADYSMREVLANIAAMYGGNFVMNYDGELLFIPIRSMPAETNYLVTENGNPITFGGVRILV